MSSAGTTVGGAPSNKMSDGVSAILLADIHPLARLIFLGLSCELSVLTRDGQEECSELRVLQFARLGVDGPARRRRG